MRHPRNALVERQVVIARRVTMRETVLYQLGTRATRYTYPEASGVATPYRAQRT
jgi:hypothetical protein